MSTLVLVRHGQSVWNAEDRFTGWVDSPLSPHGREEATRAGALLAAAGLVVDRAFTSQLVRAQDTGRLILAALGRGALPQEAAWQLNERFYGALTGRTKAECRAEFGEEQVRRWRRSATAGPPGGESLADTARRTLPYFTARVLPATRQHGVVLVTAHGNSLRAVVKHLSGLDDDAIATVEIATGVPLLYDVVDGRAGPLRVLA